MALSARDTETLVRLVQLTRDQEIDCDDCLQHVAELAEAVLAGRSDPEGLEAVRHHLALCTECNEEFRALKRALAASG
ncbi:MAG: hypothetical protein AAGC60_05185 [Acidobacteriota bacterium]